MGATDTPDIVKIMRVVLVVALAGAPYSAYCLVAAPRVRDQAAQVLTITCDELIRNGPGGRRYIALSEACLLGEKSVSESDWETGAIELYHPLHSASLPKPPQPRDLALVLCITDEMARRRLRDDWKRREQLGQLGLSAFTCEVGRAAKLLPEWANKGLRAQFPGIQPNCCWLVKVSGYEPTADRAEQFFRHGFGSALAATALLVGWGFWRWRAADRAANQLAFSLADSSSHEPP
jgi:hypothetical protein